jgi:hypothetical protein
MMKIVNVITESQQNLSLNFINIYHTLGFTCYVQTFQ